LVLKVFGRTHHLGVTGVDGIVGVAFIGEFALEPSDQLPGPYSGVRLRSLPREPY